MANKTKIEWTDATWNPIIGCSNISEGCRNCYAEKFAKRIARMLAGGQSNTWAKYSTVINTAGQWNGMAVRTNAITDPLGWKRPKRIFVCSMGDLFHESVPFEWIDDVMAVIALCQQHVFQILTKRPRIMRDYFSQDRRADIVRQARNYSASRLALNWPPDNVWLGITAENQKHADKRIPILLDIPAKIRFASCEPLLGGIDFQPRMLEGVNWIIIGGETGHVARPMQFCWAESIISQAKNANIPVFFKQLGSNFSGNREECEKSVNNNRSFPV